MQLDNNVTLDEYGFVVATDDLAQCIFSPILGYVADRNGSIRFVSILCCGVFTIGNIFYSGISLVPKSIGSLKQARLVSMLIARFLVGIGTANIAPDRSYVAKATKPEERITHICLLSLFQTLGFVLGPAIQAALSPIGEKTDISDESTVHVDMYSGCGYVGAITGLISLIMFLPGIFNEYILEESVNEEPVIKNELMKAKSTTKYLIREFSTISFTGPPPLRTQKSVVLPTASVNLIPKTSFWEAEKPNVVATVACCYMLFAALINYTMAETIATPLVMDQFAWNREQAVRYLGINMACAALVGVVCFASIGPLAKRFDDRKLLIFVGFIPLIIGKVIMLPMGKEYPQIKGNVTCVVNETECPNGTKINNFGCSLDWCDKIPKITMGQYFVSTYITLVGYPFVVALPSGIFSRVLGNIPQGFWMGVFTTCGGLSRVFGPIATSTMYQHLGTYWTYGCLIIILLLALIFALAAYQSFKKKEVIAIPSNVACPSPIQNGSSNTHPKTQSNLNDAS